MAERVTIMGFADRKKADLACALEAQFALQRGDESAMRFVEQCAAEDTQHLSRHQDVRYGPNTMNVPAAYLENPWAYKGLIALVQNNPGVILFVADSNQKGQESAPGLAKAFPSIPLGVIVGSALEDADLAKGLLSHLGVTAPYARVDLENDQEVHELFLQVVSYKGATREKQGRCLR